MILPVALPALLIVAAPAATNGAAMPAGLQASPPELADPLADPAAGAPVQASITPPGLADPLADPERAAPPSASVTVVDAKPHHAPGDPLENLNRRLFRAHEKFDRAIFRPAALGYKHVVPGPIRDGLRNVFSNLGEPVVFLNYLLQAKPGKAIETFTRFLFNTIFGFGGLFDIAKSPYVRLPHRPNSFGDTLALYGVKPGPYLFLPFVGPTTLRDLLGGQADGLVLPLAVGSPFDKLAYQVPKGVITGLDKRAEADDELHALFSGAVDPYATLRSVYLQNRAGEIARLRGTRQVAPPPAPQLGEPLAHPADTGLKPAAPELSDPLADPAASAPPTTAPSPEPSEPMAPPASTPAMPQPLGHPR